MNAVQNFVFEENLVRVIERDGQPWFVANDVCKCLGLSNPRKAVADLDEDEKGVTTGYTPGGEQGMNIVSMPGVFNLIFRSRKPEAKRFKRWVTHDVLPQIHKTGEYRPGQDKGAASTDTLAYEIDMERAPLSAKVDLLRFVERHYGRRSAVEYMKVLGLPVPAGPIAAARGGFADEQATDCLRFLLDWQLGGEAIGDLAIRAADGEPESGAALEQIGIRATPEGFWIVAAHDGMQAIWNRTKWRGIWRTLLHRLPGVTIGHERISVGGKQGRPLWLPLSMLN